MSRSPFRGRRARVATALLATTALGGGLVATGLAARSQPTAGDAAKSGTTLRLRASATALKFNHTTLRARRGRVTLVMANPASSQIPHAIAIEGKGIDKDGRTVQGGGTSRVTVTLRKRGRYTFYCPVDGHERAGMKGRLIVR
jgi:uncharacterized cupredoxin-like copper-binding protein